MRLRVLRHMQASCMRVCADATVQLRERAFQHAWLLVGWIAGPFWVAVPSLCSYEPPTTLPCLLLSQCFVRAQPVNRLHAYACGELSVLLPPKPDQA